MFPVLDEIWSDAPDLDLEPNAVRQIGWAGLITGIIFGIGTGAFIMGITHTSVANTLFLVSTSPLFGKSRAILNAYSGSQAMRQGENFNSEPFSITPASTIGP